MKVIDLLNKIANCEEVPERIKVDNIVYIYENWEHFYYTDNEAREDLLIRGKDYSTSDFLNWNVELIQEDTIDSIEELKMEEEWIQDGLNPRGCLNYKPVNPREIPHKINEIIRKVNQLAKQTKE